jgi:hypothetical protein
MNGMIPTIILAQPNVARSIISDELHRRAKIKRSAQANPTQVQRGALLNPNIFITA